jgi:hypothetical protein
MCAYLWGLKWPHPEVDLGQIDWGQAGLFNSFKRAMEMLRALRDFGFVSFFK